MKKFTFILVVLIGFMLPFNVYAHENQYVSRSEFVKELVCALKLDIDNNAKCCFKDVTTEDEYYNYIACALENGIIIPDDYMEEQFEPNKNISREELAIIVVRALGYDYLAKTLEPSNIEFEDVENNKGYILIASDFEILKGKSQHIFDPNEYISKQDAQNIIIKVKNILNNKILGLNGFYAISSYSQIDKINIFDTISYGWSRIEYNDETEQIQLATGLPVKDYPFYIPNAYDEALDEAEQNNIKKYLMVFGSDENKIFINGKGKSIVSTLISDDDNIKQVVKSINKLTSGIKNDKNYYEFEGVVVDFECLRNYNNNNNNFIKFLFSLKAELYKYGKELVVCVHPKRESGQAYYDGYNYKAIGQLADKVIIMAHDYYPKQLYANEKDNFTGDTPLAPVKDIYYALKYAIDNGIAKDKIVLQISFDSIQWDFKEGNITNNIGYKPSYTIINEKMKDVNIRNKELKYSTFSQAPYFIILDDNLKTKKIIWYEDSRSINAKIDLAKKFGIKNISVWRLGIIPNIKNSDGLDEYLNLWELFKDIKK